jgi:hypothetical protein
MLENKLIKYEHKVRKNFYKADFSTASRKQNIIITKLNKHIVSSNNQVLDHKMYGFLSGRADQKNTSINSNIFSTISHPLSTTYSLYPYAPLPLYKTKLLKMENLSTKYPNKIVRKNNLNHTKFSKSSKKLIKYNKNTLLKSNIHKISISSNKKAFFSTNNSTNKPITISNDSNVFFNYQIEEKNKRFVRARFRKAPENKTQLINTKCLLPLSIGQQPYHYGAYFAATLKLVDDTFSSILFVGCDTLQRYNRAIQLNKSPEDCRQQTKEEWDRWLIINHPMLARLSIRWAIIRWDSFLKDPAFQKHLNLVELVYNIDKKFQKICHNNVEIFLERMESRNEIKVPRELAWKYSLAYLLEECAAMFLWKREDCKFELYPSTRSPAMQYIWETLFEPDILIPVSLDFRLLKNYTYPKEYSHQKNKQNEPSSENFTNFDGMQTIKNKS